MNLPGAIYLGTRYLARHRGKAVLLISAITLSLFLPLAISLVVRQAEAQLRARAEVTPLLLGAKGSPLELVFNGLYFSKPDLAKITHGTAQQLLADGQAKVIPIYARYSARKNRIVGASLEYFRFRNLKIADGRMMTRLGDCVLGASVAEKLGLGPGDTVVSTPEQMFDIAGVYPLKMRITGVLAPSNGPDDRVLFVDLKTAWIIEGIAHGHEDATPETTLETEDGVAKLNASVREYTEITDANVDSFHFHGDVADFPITAAIVLPKDDRAAALLLGKFVGDSATEQLIRPARVMSELFDTVFQIRNLVVAALAAVGIASALIAGLVFLLSNRLRAREFESLANIGADPATVRLLVLFEAAFVCLTSILIAGLLLLILMAITPLLLPTLMSS